MSTIILAALLVTAFFMTSSLHIQPTSAQSVLAAGVNYMSAGNVYGDSNTVLETDFARFAKDGIKHISMRLMWSTLEPTYNSQTCVLSPSVLANAKRVLTMAQKYGIGVNVDFWTQFTYKLGLPKFMSSYYDILPTNEAGYNHWLRYVQAVTTALKSYPAIESWAILNEPFYSSSSQKVPFQNLFAAEVKLIKSIDSTRPVVCRFTLSYTPGSGKYDASVYDIFDAFAVTEYLDPSNPKDTRYNGRWSYWDKTVADCKARNKPLWVIEFGDDNTNPEHVRLHYQLSLQKFQAAGVVKAYAWAWQTRSATSEAFNIYSGTAPKPAFYELTQYPAGSYVPPPANITPPLPPQPSTQNYTFEDSFESRTFKSWTGTSLSTGASATVKSSVHYDGYYSASFATNGNNQGTQKSYLYKSVDMKEVYVRGYVLIGSSGAWGSQILTDNSDTLYLIQLMASTQTLAQVGIRRQAGVNQWVLTARSGTFYSTTPDVSGNRWYCIELHWSATQGLAEMFVDGTKILKATNLNTVSFGNVSMVDFGIVTATNVQNPLTVSGDYFSISRTYNGQ